MKTLSKLLILSSLLMLFSCNEKVASELKNSANVGPADDNDIEEPEPPKRYTFGLRNTSDPVLNYRLHRTGFSRKGASYETNREVSCIVESPEDVELSNKLYDAEAQLDGTGTAPALTHDEKKYDISCFLEAEEASLYSSGFSLQVEASADACEFVGYSPFSYFNWIPGDSTTDYKTIRCPDDATQAPPAVDHGGMTCGDYRNVNPDGSDAYSGENIATPANEAELCRFDYTADGGPNCDVGTVTITEYSYQLSDPEDPASALVPAPGAPNVRRVECRGKAQACIDGPIKLLTANYEDGFIKEINRTTKGQPFFKSYDFPGLIGQNGRSNRKYVNYRRDLANPNIDYSDRSNNGSNTQANLDIAYQAYKDAYNHAISGFNLWDMTFDPNFMDNYSKNRRMRYPLANNNRYIDVNGPEYRDLYEDQAYKAKPFASEPFQSVKSGLNVNPFYTFYCMDKGSENKARIRLVVREWDKIFRDPTSFNDFDLLTDIFKDFAASQDNNALDNYGEEVNDYEDWDDLIHMRRTTGALDTGSVAQDGDGFTDFVPMIFVPIDETSWNYVNNLWDPVNKTSNSTNARFNIDIFPQDP